MNKRPRTKKQAEEIVPRGWRVLRMGECISHGDRVWKYNHWEDAALIGHYATLLTYIRRK